MLGPSGSYEVPSTGPAGPVCPAWLKYGPIDRITGVLSVRRQMLRAQDVGVQADPAARRDRGLRPRRAGWHVGGGGGRRQGGGEDGECGGERGSHARWNARGLGTLRQAGTANCGWVGRRGFALAAGPCRVGDMRGLSATRSRGGRSRLPQCRKSAGARSAGLDLERTRSRTVQAWPPPKPSRSPTLPRRRRQRPHAALLRARRADARRRRPGAASSHRRYTEDDLRWIDLLTAPAGRPGCRSAACASTPSSCERATATRRSGSRCSRPIAPPCAPARARCERTSPPSSARSTSTERGSP